MTTSTKSNVIAINEFPPHYNPANSRKADYQANPTQLQKAAEDWKKRFGLKPVASDQNQIVVLDIDDQGDFDFPSGSLFVAGRSGTGAMDAMRRRVEFGYRYMANISEWIDTMDSHLPYQVFYGSAHMTRDGELVQPNTMISADEYKGGVYRPNPAMAAQIGADTNWLHRQWIHYCERLEESGKYKLFIWPYHCMIGSPGHRLAGLTEEFRLFHSFARGAANNPEIKGGNPLTEHYSIFAPEVTTTWDGKTIPGAQKNTRLINRLLRAHRVFIIGEAASHCVRTSIADLLTEIKAVDIKLAQKVVILRDCTAAVVIPNVVDFTDEAEKALQEFQDAGMNVVSSTDYGRIEELMAA